MAVDPVAAELSHVGSSLARAAGLANGVGAIIVFGYLAVLPRVFATRSAIAAGRSIDPVVVAAFVGYFVLSGVVGALTGSRLGRPLAAWAARGGDPTETERAAVLGQPWRQANNGFYYWAGAAIFFSVLVALRPHWTPLASAVTGGGITLAAVTVWLVSFLLVERAMRPVTAIALGGSGAPHGQRTLNIRAKFLWTWALGAGVPLLAIAGTPLLARDAVVPLDEVLVVIALAVGAYLVLSSSRSVADPISEVTATMERVADGDLKSKVSVDDASEVGRLQAGFNSMVAGLRERALLEDLFGRHVGIDVARHELERGVGLGGELREISALFVDVIGSTSMTQERPANAVVDMLNALFAAIARCAEAEGGWVNKFVGDAALVIVGAPRECADHAARALRIATAVRSEVVALARAHEGLDVGIGVSTGVAVAGNIGAEQRYEYTVIGDPVNEASRLSDAAKLAEGRVLASSEAVAAAGADGAQWEPYAELELRGRAQRTRAYRPLGVTSAATE